MGAQELEPVQPAADRRFHIYERSRWRSHRKGAFKTKCWESQVDFIDRFDLQQVFGSGNAAFVMYVCRTKNGKTFRNVEYLRLRNDKVQAIECYFGAQSSFPSAVSTSWGDRVGSAHRQHVKTWS
jgi:hypothetical protein